MHVHEEIFHVDDPTTYEEALLDKDSSRWLEAMKAKMDSIYANQVWSLVDPPKGVIPIGCKWILKRKIGADGKVETYKTRLVAKGFRQREGIDYEETFSPITMLKSIQMLLASFIDQSMVSSKLQGVGIIILMRLSVLIVL